MNLTLRDDSKSCETGLSWVIQPVWAGGWWACVSGCCLRSCELQLWFESWSPAPSAAPPTLKKKLSVTSNRFKRNEYISLIIPFNSFFLSCGILHKSMKDFSLLWGFLGNMIHVSEFTLRTVTDLWIRRSEPVCTDAVHQAPVSSSVAAVFTGLYWLCVSVNDLWGTKLQLHSSLNNCLSGMYSWDLKTGKWLMVIWVSMCLW